MYKRKYNYIRLSNKNEPKKSLEECKSIYNLLEQKNSDYELYPFDDLKDDVVIDEKLKEDVTNYISAFISKKIKN